MKSELENFRLLSNDLDYFYIKPITNIIDPLDYKVLKNFFSKTFRLIKLYDLMENGMNFQLLMNNINDKENTLFIIRTKNNLKFGTYFEIKFPSTLDYSPHISRKTSKNQLTSLQNNNNNNNTDISQISALKIENKQGQGMEKLDEGIRPDNKTNNKDNKSIKEIKDIKQLKDAEKKIIFPKHFKDPKSFLFSLTDGKKYNANQETSKQLTVNQKFFLSHGTGDNENCNEGISIVRDKMLVFTSFTNEFIINENSNIFRKSQMTLGSEINNIEVFQIRF